MIRQEMTLCMTDVDVAGMPIEDTAEVQRRVLTARQRLREFAFVGLTEQWALSVCLFHVKFGGLCRPSDFANTNPSRNSSAKTSGKYDADAWLGGDYHIVDNAIYREAFNIFHEDLRRFNVTEASCQRCFQDG